MKMTKDVDFGLDPVPHFLQKIFAANIVALTREVTMAPRWSMGNKDISIWRYGFPVLTKGLTPW